MQGEATASDLARVFSCWRFLVYFTSTEKWDQKTEVPWRSWNVYFFGRVSICLTSMISTEIWQMVISSENVFKENLMLQCSWLGEFCYGKVSGWWTLDELQYENGWTIILKLCRHISNRLLLKSVPRLT